MKASTLDHNKGSIGMFKVTSSVKFMLPLHFKEMSKILKHKPLTFKGFF